MKQELEDALVRDFPVLFAGVGRSPKTTPMAFGFECGDGWERVIREAAESLEWLNRTGSVHIEAAQVKEKFGTLRLYLSVLESTPDFPVHMVWDIEWAAEARSGVVCENCGKPGKLREGGWLRTLCNECEAKRT